MAKGSLLTFSTPDFRLSLHGPIPSRNSYALLGFPGATRQPTRKQSELIDIAFVESTLRVPIFHVERLTAEYRDDQLSLELGTGFMREDEERFLPLLFENIDYQILLTNKVGSKFVLWHEHSTIRESLASLRDQQSSFGSINFGNNVGMTTFELRENDRTHFRMTLSVFPAKLGFIDERQAMMEELTKVHHALVLQLFRPTQSLRSVDSSRSLGVEWLTSFKELSIDLIRTAQRIEKKAHNQIRTSRDLVTIRKITRPNRSFLRQVTVRGKNAVLSRRSVLIDVRKVDINTAENKYIKFLMKHLAATGRRWVGFVKTSRLETLERIATNETLIQELERSIAAIEQRSKNEFWEAVGDEIAVLSNKTSFLFQELFVKFEKLFKTINRALSVHMMGSRLLYTLPMDRLYETWCYCKLAQVVFGIVDGTNGTTIPKAKVDAFQAILKTGRGSTIHINDDIALALKWRFRTNASDRYFSPIIPQEPDLVFEVKNLNELNLLDAKYRINVLLKHASGYLPGGFSDLVSRNVDAEFVCSAKDEDINTMHRYKDAIRASTTTNPFSRIATRYGIILYPYRPGIKELSNIDEVLQGLQRYGIAAIPLCPGIADIDWLTSFPSIEQSITFGNTEQIRIFANAVSMMLERTDATAN